MLRVQQLLLGGATTDLQQPPHAQLLQLDIHHFALRLGFVLQRGDFRLAMRNACEQEAALLRPVVEAQLIGLVVLADRAGIDGTESGGIERAPGQQRLDPFFHERKILRPDRQGCELGLRQDSVHMDQRLILLHDLTLLHQDLIDDASLEMLHRANLRHRY